MKRWNKKVRVKVPASTSNLGPGFDVLGIAFKHYNEVEVAFDAHAKPGLSIEVRGEGRDNLPRDSRNAVWQCFKKAVPGGRLPTGHFTMKCVNRIPLARGLGSSAAARLSGILAGNAFCGNPMTLHQVIDLATAMEGHPDNVVPAAVGGLCLSTVEGIKVKYIRMALPAGLAAVVCVPQFELSTDKARAVLPKSVTRADAVFNVSRVSLLLGAIATRDFSFLKTAMEDRIHQPYRKKLVPGFDAVVKGALKSGAFGAALSGAGPTMFAFAPKHKARAVGAAMERGFASAGKRAQSLALDFELNGSRVEPHL